jgi:predicted DsbA family dithiol-disulfide isomerase
MRRREYGNGDENHPSGELAMRLVTLPVAPDRHGTPSTSAPTSADLCHDLVVATSLSVDVWSDVICPFCYLGSRQLELALANFEHAEDVVVNHHAFELDPHARTDYDASLAELVAAKYAMPVERAQQLHANLTAQANSLGVSMDFEIARPTNTFDAHRLIALSATQGKGEEMTERLFRAYFAEGRLVSDHEQLNALADEVGVSDAPLLWETEAFASDVRADESSAEQLGISGVPAFLVDNKFMVLGAQGVEKIVDVLERAWTRQRA